MDHQSLRNVLGILRLLKFGNPGHSALHEMQGWAGSAVSADETLKIAIYVMEQANLARTVIINSQLSDEAKAGVLATVDGVIAAFSIQNLQSAWSQFIKDVTSAIGNLVILLSALNIPVENENPQEALDLIVEIESIKECFNDPEIDPAVKDIALRHIEILLTMLRHIPIFGVEPAMTTYFELMVKVRRADVGSSSKAHSKAKPIVERIEGWGKAISSIDKIVNSGARLLQHAGKARDMLSFIPDGN